MGLGMIQVISYSVKPYPGYWYLSHLLIPFTFGTPLLLYPRFRFLIQGVMIKIHPLIIIILTLVSLFIAAGPIFGDRFGFIKEYAELRPLTDPAFAALPLYYKCVHLINFSGKLILGAGLLTILVKTMYLWNEIEKERVMLARMAYIFTIMMFLTSVLGIVGDIVSFEFSKGAIAMVNTVTLGVFFSSQYDPGYYAIFKHLRQKKKYAISKVLSLDVDSVIDRLNSMMIENHLYMEEDLSIKTVAEMLDVNHQQLSEIINRKLNRSFSCYVNDFKLSDAKKFLINEPEFTVTRIALMTGFNSVRTFNRVFAKNIGLTPLEYRKKFNVHRP
jgi:AraC-like DNA-binding protein